MKTQDIKRKDAARFIDSVLMLVAQLEEGAHSKEKPDQIANRLRTLASEHGLDVPRVCNGEAHSNPHIDNCGVCMPNWGWVSKETKVR